MVILRVPSIYIMTYGGCARAVFEGHSEPRTQAKPMSAHTSSISAWAAHVDLSSRPTSRLRASRPQTACPPFELFALPEAQDLIHPFPNTSMFGTPSQQQDHFGDALKFNERDVMVAQRLERFYKV